MCDKERRCIDCKQTKSIELFPRYTKDGYYKRSCRVCDNARQRANYRRNKDLYKKCTYRWREKNYTQYLEYQKDYAKKNPELFKEWKKNNKEKTRAHYVVCMALKKKKIEKATQCQICGKKDEKLQGHHNDYNKPLEVIWVCSTCHNNIHHHFSNHKEVANL